MHPRLNFTQKWKKIELFILQRTKLYADMIIKRLQLSGNDEKIKNDAADKKILMINDILHIKINSTKSTLAIE